MNESLERNLTTGELISLLNAEPEFKFKNTIIENLDRLLEFESDESIEKRHIRSLEDDISNIDDERDAAQSKANELLGIIKDVEKKLKEAHE